MVRLFKKLEGLEDYSLLNGKPSNFNHFSFPMGAGKADIFRHIAWGRDGLRSVGILSMARNENIPEHRQSN